MKSSMYCTLTFAAALLGATLSFSQNSREITKSLPLKANGEVAIDTYKGSITVSVWDKPQVDIRARIEADDQFDSRYAEEKVRDTEIQIDATENRIRIKTDYDNLRHHDRGFFSFFDGESGSLPLVHYTVSMPKTANLKIKDYKSRTTVDNLNSDVDFTTYKGEAEISNLEGSLRLDTYRGDVRVTFIKLTGRSSCKTYKGRLSLVLPAKSGFDLDAEFGYRTDFSTDFDCDVHSHGRRHRNAEFHGPVNGGGATLVLRSTKGDIRLRQH
jgi:hypothetical protein